MTPLKLDVKTKIDEKVHYTILSNINLKTFRNAQDTLWSVVGELPEYIRYIKGEILPPLRKYWKPEGD